MKPLNLDNRPCSPVSSNCVIWQGPTLNCINLCTGDTISDVMAKMAEELCTLLDQTNVDNYDLTCLGVTSCGPKDFQALIQLLIDKICELNNLPIDDTKSEGACPDCVVTVASCLREQDSNLPATMQLLDYVQLLANKICSIIDVIGDLQDQIDNLNIRVTILEEATPPSFVIPSFTLACQIGTLTGAQFINIILQEFINNVWCDFYATTGTTSELSNAVQSICILDTDLQLTTGTPFSTNPNWVDAGSYNTVADAINNIWIALCDVYNASVSVQDTNTIDLNYTGGILTANIQDTGWVDLNGFEFYAAGVGRPQCRRIGNVVHFRGTAVIPLEAVPGGSPLEFNNSAGGNTYITQTSVAPSTTGVGSVYLNVDGAIYFNANTSVIPSSVVASTASGGFYFDNAYTKQFTLGTRGILIENSAAPTDLISTALNTVGTLIITKDGKLAITIIRDAEETNVSAYQSNYSYHTSHLNYIISHVVLNEFVPNFQALATTVHSSSGSGIQTVDIDHTQSGTWTIARSAPTTPLIYKYRFSFNGNDINSLGGVAYNLDGLMAYIDPCTTDIKSYNCP